MGRIHILSDTVANKIAAGEVVERPASVVKELLENSLDAGATEIRIEVESGGRRLIRVADNGCGMLRDDAMLAFERHATSKLRDVADLQAIATLGFRGEALPSIASVSRLLLETRSAGETTGTTVEIAGGKLLRCDESGLAAGTVVTVRDLFFNVPARRKFLRTEQTELAHVASLATHYSLAHPAKTFQLRSGTNELLAVTPVETLRDRVYQVFRAQVLEALIELEYRERELKLPAGPEDDQPVERVFGLRGFVSRPQVQKLNRNSIYLFVNGRLIRDRLLLHALSAAYHNLMPAGCYPFALLFLDLDCEEVDVNVHPSKTEVRFHHATFVHDFVRDTLRELLMERRPVSAAPQPGSPQPAADLPYSEFTQALENSALAEAGGFGFEPGGGEQLPVVTLRPPPAPPPRFHFGDGAIAVERSGSADPAPARLPVPETHGGFPGDDLPVAPQSMAGLGDLRPLGQIHDSFIIAAGRDGLWIIDQHVAHERILFEKVLAERMAGAVETQRLLIPMLVELSAAQHLQYARIAEELNATGFETEPFGNRTIAVKAAPAGVTPADVEKLVFEILEVADAELRGLSADDVRRGIAASIACRAAIKIHTRLDQQKMEWLLSRLASTRFPMSCPHGRPVALRYSTTDILKGFHRI
ncbi:MAG: DNA mismatch repair endonuclease MutL [Acidobacteria bacterium]|nr:DNA mismatch repair endonuclease MutL [Acidobacteriota bacterium]MBI3279019.1 DNA mismatch repair endonuclease MutL [Acidobacteriota bacterium]